jgi:hypothetical protein
MNIHIAHDDKFIDYIIDITKKLNGTKNKFIIYQETPQPIKFIRNVDSVSILDINSKELSEIFACKTYPETVNIYIHFLNPLLYRLILTTPEHINLVWCFWGEDAFALPKLRNRFLSKMTKSILDSDKIENNNYTFTKYLNPKEIYRYYYRLFKNYKQRKKYENLVNSVIRRFNYFAHYIKEDYNIIRTKYPLKATFINFSYMSIEAAFNFQLPEKLSKGNNILLGNSANPTNNHLDAIDVISKELTITEINIYCPINYSVTSKKYKKKVLKLGSMKLGKQFCPILNFLNKTEYYNILDDCSFAIMPQYRSQAWGNIMVLLWIGNAVFLSNKSSLFNLLKNNYQIKIFSIEKDIHLINKPKDSILSNDDIKENRKKLVKHIGEEMKVKIMEQLLNIG